MSRHCNKGLLTTKKTQKNNTSLSWKENDKPKIDPKYLPHYMLL